MSTVNDEFRLLRTAMEDAARTRRAVVLKMRRAKYTFGQIGEALGVSRQRASQLFRRAIKDKK